VTRPRSTPTPTEEDKANVRRERLHRLARPDVPHLCCGVASTRHEQIGVRCQRYATRSATRPDQPSPTHATRHPRRDPPHDIAGMIVKLHRPDTLFDVPEHARHVSRARHDLPIVDEPTTAEITRMRRQLPGDLYLTTGTSRSCTAQRVDRTNVVQTTAGDKVPRGRVRAGHDPR
jgi:hypothetical protein